MLRILTICLLAFVAISEGLVTSPKEKLNYKVADESLDNYIKAILTQLRIAMPNGIPELGIPVLDPFQVPHFDIPHVE